ncbi:MAG: HAD hydrolase family protein, partial [Parabacteroides sp.]|nr:HAD hydrolase family protein [Parabacteroides sp.]
HWKKRLSGSLDLLRSEDYFLEIVPPSVDKGNTLSVLMEMLKVPKEEVIVIGDGVADVTMLQTAGIGIAMGNARDSVKACTDHITVSNNMDGVAVAVETAILANIKLTSIPLDAINARAKHALMGNLGIQYTYASENRVEATMPVDERTRQPFGILHGGATLALAETAAGLGSMILAQPDELIVGMQVSGSHVSSAHEGDTVRAVATIIHKGRTSHVWNVDVFTSTDKLVSTVRVVNSVIKKK